MTYDRTPVADEEEVQVGASTRLQPLVTSGHTFSRLSYALTVGGERVAVSTGGSLLHCATGRPD